MDLANVMDELGDQLATIADLTVYRWPPSSVSVPAAVVSYPDSIDLDATYSRGFDDITLPVVVVVGRASDRAARDAIAAYCAGSGSSSVKAVLEAGEYTAFGALRVTGVEFDVVTIGTAEYLAATFAVDITGGGAE